MRRNRPANQLAYENMMTRAMFQWVYYNVSVPRYDYVDIFVGRHFLVVLLKRTRYDNILLVLSERNFFTHVEYILGETQRLNGRSCSHLNTSPTAPSRAS